MIKQFPSGSHKKVGSGYPKWIPDKNIIVPGSFEVRRPSNAFPNSYLRHFYTKKFAGLVLEHYPLLYAKLHGIDDFRTHVLKAIGGNK